MNEHFRALVDRDLSCCLFSFCLSSVVRRIFLVSFATHGPSIFTRYNMLVLAHCLSFLEMFHT